ncbi:T9SS type A sorting domain-containing protein [Chryseobacterium capnotolerans]|uniref:T9SS type A sorting domain-containing protein n=1 Tax=Chryseobacterium TaxID=59732 RepID=UPI00083A53A6|nr:MULTISPECIES: T9SS type A sorting domain-containing protein [Chryseobacterium]UHO40041.1 T9SS type A sorting domain-containing protein [Chryseobacterium capnotolerans]
MKKILIGLLMLSSGTAFSQQTISFEASEGYTAGNINGQKGWVTPNGAEEQTVNAEKASVGTNSLKLKKNNFYCQQGEAVMGAFYNLPSPLMSDNFTVSFDIYLRFRYTSNYEFQAVNSKENKTVVRAQFTNSGAIKISDVTNPSSGTTDLLDTAGVWPIASWKRFKAVGSATEIKYYLDNILIYKGARANSSNIDQLRFVHDNFGEYAYIDNIKINNESSDTAPVQQKISIYPNPSSDFITILSPNKIKNVVILSGFGKQINVNIMNDKIDIRNLLPGMYLLNVETEGRNFTEKFVKK